MEAQDIHIRKVESEEPKSETTKAPGLEHQTFNPEAVGNNPEKPIKHEGYKYKPRPVGLKSDSFEEDDPNEIKSNSVGDDPEKSPKFYLLKETNAVEIHPTEYISVLKIEPQTVELRGDGHEMVEPQIANTQEVDCALSFQEGNKIQETVLCLKHQNLVLWRQPLLTLAYFLKEFYLHLKDAVVKVLFYYRILLFIITVLCATTYLNRFHGLECPTLLWAQRMFLWCLYWFSLGILSSVGLGMGIHTFALYLGPYIASVTMAETGCGIRDVDSEDSPCLQEADPPWVTTLWNIMCRVRLESYMWGLGTAVGELPSYFVGRAARLSEQDDGTDVLREFEELLRKKNETPSSLSRLDRVKLFVRDLVVKAGFWGILASASIPNPFFDLVGITCGHFLVPFWTFFIATIVGKSIIKTTIQQVFIILSFNNAFLSVVVDVLSSVPLVGLRLQTHLSQYIEKQKKKFAQDEIDETENNSWFLKAYHFVVICTFIYFIISIVNSLAQNHYKRLERELQKESNNDTFPCTKRKKQSLIKPAD